MKTEKEIYRDLVESATERIKNKTLKGELISHPEDSEFLYDVTLNVKSAYDGWEYAEKEGFHGRPIQTVSRKNVDIFELRALITLIERHSKELDLTSLVEEKLKQESKLELKKDMDSMEKMVNSKNKKK